MNEKKKVQFYVSAEEARQLTALVEEAHRNSLSDVLREALSLYSWVVRELARGSQLQVVDVDDERYKVVLPWLSGVRPPGDRAGDTRSDRRVRGGPKTATKAVGA